MRKILDHVECEAVLLVDAEIAFSTTVIKSKIHNIEIKCLRLV